MTTWIYEQSIHFSRPFSMPPDMIRELFDSLCETQEVETVEGGTCKCHNLPWVRPILLLTKK